MDRRDPRFLTSPQVWLLTEDEGVVRADLIMRVWTGRCERVSISFARDHAVWVQLSDDLGTHGATRAHIVGRADTAEQADELMADLLVEIDSALRGQESGCIEVHPDRGPELMALRRRATAIAGA